MNRKTILLCVSAVAGFAVLVAFLLYFLYSGSGDSKSALTEGRDTALLSAVPSDASCVIKYNRFGSLVEAFSSEESSMRFVLGGRKGKLKALMDTLYSDPRPYQSVLSCQSVLSAHNLGVVTPLLLIDAGRFSEEPSDAVSSFMSMAESLGLQVSYEDMASCVPSGSPLKKHGLLMVSESDVLLAASLRHLRTEVSVLDVNGLSESVECTVHPDLLIIPGTGIRNMFSGVLSREFLSGTDFLFRFADCTAFEIRSFSDDRLSLSGRPYAGASLQKFMNVFRGSSPAQSTVASVLPSYTVFAATVPMGNVVDYLNSYQKFAETLALSRDLERRRNELGKECGIDPVLWAESLGIREVSVASFVVDGKLEKIVLARASKKNPQLFPGKDAKGESAVVPFRYAGFIQSLFGSLFSIPDESSVVFLDDWMIVGSAAALSEYASGRATGYTLEKFMEDASIKNLMARKDACFASYFSASEDVGFTESVFRKDFYEVFRESLKDISYEPLFLTVGEDKNGMSVDFDMFRTVVLKSQAPAYERNAEVIVPEGPFKVKNSGTGKMNLFYQQENGYLCLQEEGGKGLWGVPFKGKICGRARTVDYFANGKLQILFASGSKLHLIDRLGRFVQPFPVDLKKDILLGPDVYDFSGRKKYNVMVLHKDNTVEMYNLQGKRPEQWKTIAAPETVMGLPERIEAGGRTFWVVRTSIQTLIYPFYGGEPVTSFTGDKMIRPDSRIEVSGKDAVEVTCYDGKRHTVKLHTK